MSDGSAYQRVFVTLLQSAPIDFDVEGELAQLEADIRADERRQIDSRPTDMSLDAQRRRWIKAWTRS